MRGYRWLFAIAGLIGVSFFVFGGSSDAVMKNGTVTLARQAAIQGLNETAQMLVADSESWASHPDKYAFLNASLDGARYSTSVTAPYGPAPLSDGCSADTVDVVSTAALDTGESHRVEATYVRTCGDDVGIRLVSFAER